MLQSIQEHFKRLPGLVKLAFIATIGFICFEAVVLGMASFSAKSKIDPGLATLLGAVIGFSVVAWQARAGFQNLIRSQENQARKALRGAKAR
jgi:heme A synthase